MLPSVPPSLAAAAGGVAKSNTPAKAPADAATTGASPGIAASEQSGDRDADGRDLSQRRRNRNSSDVDTAREQAAGVSDSGGLDVTV